jgi:hypothetical protein
MSTKRDFVEGETKPLTVTLYDGEGASQTAVVGTGLTVALALRDRNGGVVPTSGAVDWEVEADGTVTFEPDAGDLRVINSPYEARWIVTDGNGNWAAYPNGEAERWVVRR